MKEAIAVTPLGHCHHCGRALSGTVHTRTEYRVDCYSLHTGEVEPVTLRRSEDRGDVTIMRLINPIDIFTCVDCYGRPNVRAERERLFRQEDAAADAETS